jgi:hypothetical protein
MLAYQYKFGITFRHIVPSQSTIKRLFAVSKNHCAFPRCRQPLVHEGKVTGRICHIKAASPGGPRYDAAQDDDARHAFDNLLLLCPIHHDVVDADETAYTVARLVEMKASHEVSAGAPLDISDAQAQQLIFNVGSVAVSHGSVVITNNQSGGQAAHTINNFGPPKRQLQSNVRDSMCQLLLGAERGTIGFASTQGDVEAHEFKLQLMDAFRNGGWQVIDLQTFMFLGSKKGIVVTIPFKASEAGLPQVASSALAMTGQPISGNRGDMANDCGIYVQVWHA